MDVNHRLRSQRGMTIIETTVVLSVMFILAGAMSPIVSESVTTARAVKAKNDASMIAMGLINLEKDLGGDALSLSNVASAGAQDVNLPEVLASDGTAPATEEVATDSGGLSLASLFSRGSDEAPARRLDARMLRQRRSWIEKSRSSMGDHLVTNRHGYRFRRPGEYGGWNGPYVSADIKGDPWGNQFLINSEWLDGGTTAADANGNARRAVFVVSAGSDGVIQTPFDQPITDARAAGDDIVIRIQ
jgi:type II secretory pathway pseudopilin PulG